MIEDGTGSQHSGQLGPGSGGLGMVTKQQQDDVGQRPQYSMPGILHFLQTEWARFEMERSQWEVERAELQVSQKIFDLLRHCILIMFLLFMHNILQYDFGADRLELY